MKTILAILLSFLLFPASAVGETLIVDNTDIGFSTEGNWAVSTSRPGYYGDNYQYTTQHEILRVATWGFAVSGGQYEVAAQWSAYGNRTTIAKYTILNNGQELGIVTVNQKENGGQFNMLGTFVVAEGTLIVTLDNIQGDGFIVADAIRVVDSTLGTYEVTVAWDYPTSETRATGFDIRVNGNDSLIFVAKDLRIWTGDVGLIQGENVFDMRTRAEAGIFSVWSVPAYLFVEAILSEPTDLVVDFSSTP